MTINLDREDWSLHLTVWRPTLDINEDPLAVVLKVLGSLLYSRDLQCSSWNQDWQSRETWWNRCYYCITKKPLLFTFFFAFHLLLVTFYFWRLTFDFYIFTFYFLLFTFYFWFLTFDFTFDFWLLSLLLTFDFWLWFWLLIFDFTFTFFSLLFFPFYFWLMTFLFTLNFYFSFFSCSSSRSDIVTHAVRASVCPPYLFLAYLPCFLYCVFALRL